MKGLEDIFVKEFDKEAKSRGFVMADQRPLFGVNPIYQNADWLISSAMKTMFPETTVTITFTPQNPPPEASLQKLLKCEAIWSNDKQKWTMLDREYTTSELISLAFDQIPR